MVFWKNRCSLILKRINITLGLGEVFEEYLWRSLILVKLLTENNLNWEIVTFFVSFFFFYQNRSWAAAIIVCLCFVFVFMFLNYNIVVVNIAKLLYIVLLCFTAHKNNSNKKKKVWWIWGVCMWSHTVFHLSVQMKTRSKCYVNFCKVALCH